MSAADAESLRGKTAVVTGASKGLGKAIAVALASEGCALAICAREERSLGETAAQITKSGARVLAMSCDVADAAQVERLFRRVAGEFQEIHVLVNNAGAAHPLIPVADLPLDVWNRAIATNLTGTFLCAQAALPLMKRGATIVNVLSATVKMTLPGMAAYAAAKHGALSLTDMLREELREKGIRVLGLVPGAARTDIWNQFWAEAPREKMMAPETVAAAVVHAVKAPLGTTIERIDIFPAAGKL